MKKKYRHLFFDLDKTLYDFHKSSEETLKEIYSKYHLQDKGIKDFDLFTATYKEINLGLWEVYRNGDIEKKVLNVLRFAVTLENYGIHNPVLAADIAKYYVTESPLKKALFPNVHETLSYLNDKYHMHIITNGFEEVQHTKIMAQDLSKYFDHLITSEEAGVKKPDPYIFNYALKKSGARAQESLMIGDDLEVDILGAKDAGIDQVFVNYDKLVHDQEITFEITDFIELRNLL